MRDIRLRCACARATQRSESATRRTSPKGCTQHCTKRRRCRRCRSVRTGGQGVTQVATTQHSRGAQAIAIGDSKAKIIHHADTNAVAAAPNTRANDYNLITPPNHAGRATYAAAVVLYVMLPAGQCATISQYYYIFITRSLNGFSII